MWNEERVYYDPTTKEEAAKDNEKLPSTLELENILYKNRSRRDEKIHEKALFPEVATHIETESRKALEKILGQEPPEDISLVFLAKKESNKNIQNKEWGIYNPDNNVVIVYLSDAEREKLKEGIIYTDSIAVVLHEFAHSYSYHETLAFYEKGTKMVDRDFTRSGFIEKFPSTGESENPPAIGEFLEEFFAVNVAEIGMQVLQEPKYNNRSTTAFEMLDYLSELTKTKKVDFLRYMMGAKTDPDREQAFRELLEQDGRDGLYDVLLTLNWSQDEEEDYNDRFARGFKKVKDFIETERKAF